MSPARVRTALFLGTVLAVPQFAHALVIARVTPHGYIMVDEPEAETRFNGRIPGPDELPGGNQGIASDFIVMATQAINDYEGAPKARFLAVMTTTATNSVLAYYLPITNETRGLGIRYGSREVFDTNSNYPTAYPLQGFVFLNTYNYYSLGMFATFGKYFICTQEFGHRYGSFNRVPSPPASLRDAGVTPPAGLNQLTLLGRDNAHWSYWMHSGGSPMEGNNWSESTSTPGTFTTRQPSLRFSSLDLYNMGLIPASQVEPWFVIATPTTSQRAPGGGALDRSSQPEYSGRTVTARGVRVQYTIDDVVAASGMRNPAYRPRDAGPQPNGGPAYDPVQDIDVAWVLLTTTAALNETLVNKFEQSVATCTEGYEGAAQNKAHLVAMVAPAPTDAGTGAEGGVDPSDAGGEADGDPSTPGGGGAVNGCQCSTAGSVPVTPVRGGTMAAFAVALGAMSGVSRRRRAR